MAQLFTMPQLGSTMEEGLVVLWSRREGEAVCKGDPLLEVETDKTIVEVPAPCDGVLRRVLAPADARVPIHQPLAIIGEQHEDIGPLLAQLGVAGEAAGNGRPAMQDFAGAAVTARVGQAGTQSIRQETDPGAGPDSGKDQHRGVAISPRARRLAAENNVPVDVLTGRGTGPAGRVIESDVATYLEERQRSAPAPLAPRRHLEPDQSVNDLARGLPGSQLPRDILPTGATSTRPGQPARVLSQGSVATSAIAISSSSTSTASGQLNMMVEVDMTACFELCGQLAIEVQKGYGAPLTFLAFVHKAAARALAEHPELNTSADADASASENLPLRVALALETPGSAALAVIVGAETRSLGLVAADVDRLTAAAVGGVPEFDQDTKGGLRIVDLSAYDLVRFDLALAPGQIAALGLGRIAERAVVLERQIVIRSVLNLCLTYDLHQVEPLHAARFLHRIRALLEAPVSVLV